MKPSDFKSLTFGQKVFFPTWQDLHTYKFVGVSPYSETMAVLISTSNHGAATVIGCSRLFTDYDEAKKEFVRLMEAELEKVKRVYGSGRTNP